MSIAIIGGAGFVGTRLASVLKSNHTEHKLLDKVLSDEQFIDITKPETLKSLDGSELIINLAAEHRDDVEPKSLYDQVNVVGSENICNYCRANNVNNIIFTSSVAVYGFAPEGTGENGEINYFNDYGRTKFQAEEIYRNWYNEDPNNRNLTIIRPTVIFGEGNRGNVYNLLKQISSGRFIMFGNGQNKKSMAYIENVAQVLNFSIGLEGYKLFNYVDKDDLDMNKLVSTVRSLLFGKNDVGIRFPRWLGLIAGYCFDFLAKISRKKLPVSSIRVKKFMATTSFETCIKDLGFKPKYTILKGLTNTVNYEFIEDNSTKPTFKTE